MEVTQTEWTDTISRGTRFQRTFAVKDADGEPIDVSAWDFTFEIRISDTGKLLDSYTLEDSENLALGDNPEEVVFTLSSTETALIKQSSIRVRLLGTPPDEDTEQLASGAITVNNGMLP